MSDPFVAEPVKTKNNGDVVVKITDATGANIADVSAAGAVKVDATFTPSGTQDVNLTKVAGTAVTAGSGASSAGTQRVILATDQSVIPISDNAGSLTVDDGGTTLSIDDGGGSITVDGTVAVSGSVEVSNDSGNPLPVSATTSANTAANPLFAAIGDGTANYSASNPLPVTFEGSNDGTLVDTNGLTSASLAAGASANLDSANIAAGLTGKLLEITAASTARLKVEVKRVEGTTTTSRVFMTATNSNVIYVPRDRDAITVAGAASGRNFRVTITNLDNNQSADVYASITYETV